MYFFWRLKACFGWAVLRKNISVRPQYGGELSLNLFCLFAMPLKTTWSPTAAVCRMLCCCLVSGMWCDCFIAVISHGSSRSHFSELIQYKQSCFAGWSKKLKHWESAATFPACGNVNLMSTWKCDSNISFQYCFSAANLLGSNSVMLLVLTAQYLSHKIKLHRINLLKPEH